MAKTHTGRKGQVLKRGARPTPRHRLAMATAHKKTTATPLQMAWLAPKLEMWLNDQYGDCVSAEECAAIACYSAGLGLPEVSISDSVLQAFCQRNDLLNGADLDQVIQLMQQQGLEQNGTTYTDGPGTAVDYSNEANLQNAISLGPVKLGIDADALPSGAGNQDGWTAFGGSPGQFSSEDHCVGCYAYGPTAWLAQQIQSVYGVTVALTGNAPTNGYIVYTWSTVGIVDHAWIMSTVGEAWLRTPTTLVNGVPEVGPTPPPTPVPTPPVPVPPSPPTPVPPAPAPNGWSGTVTYTAGYLISFVPAGAKRISDPKVAKSAALLTASFPGVNWTGILAEIEALIAQYGPLAIPYIESFLASLTIPNWALAIINALVSILLAGAKA